MSTDIALTKAQRSSIITLKDIASLSERTQERLTSGRKINSVTDDAVYYFQAKGLSDRAEDFDLRKDGIDQGISTMQTAMDAIQSIDSLLKQLKGMAQNVKIQSTEERVTATTQFLEVGDQLSQLVEDASYQGLNLLNRTANKLDVTFSERTTSRLIFYGFDFNTTEAGAARGIFTTAAFDNNHDMRGLSIVIDWSAVATAFNVSVAAGARFGFSLIGELNTGIGMADRTISILDKAINNLRAAATELGAMIGVLQIRLDYTSKYVEDLSVGSDKLTLADLNEEGASLVALQTRQQIGLQALKVSGDQQQAILTLLR